MFTSSPVDILRAQQALRGRRADAPGSLLPSTLQTPEDADIYAPIDVTGGSNTVIAGTPGQRLYIYSFTLWNPDATQDIAILQNTELILPLPNFPSGTGFTVPDLNNRPFRLKPGFALIITLSGPTRLTGTVRFQLR